MSNESHSSLTMPASHSSRASCDGLRRESSHSRFVSFLFDTPTERARARRLARARCLPREGRLGRCGGGVLVGAESPAEREDAHVGRRVEAQIRGHFADAVDRHELRSVPDTHEQHSSEQLSNSTRLRRSRHNASLSRGGGEEEEEQDEKDLALGPPRREGARQNTLPRDACGALGRHLPPTTVPLICVSSSTRHDGTFPKGPRVGNDRSFQRVSVAGNTWLSIEHSRSYTRAPRDSPTTHSRNPTEFQIAAPNIGTLGRCVVLVRPSIEPGKRTPVSRAAPRSLSLSLPLSAHTRERLSSRIWSPCESPLRKGSLSPHIHVRIWRQISLARALRVVVSVVRATEREIERERPLSMARARTHAHTHAHFPASRAYAPAPRVSLEVERDKTTC